MFQAESTVEESFMIIVNECKLKEGASDIDGTVVMNHDEPTSPTQKCLLACFYETIAVVS